MRPIAKPIALIAALVLSPVHAEPGKGHSAPQSTTAPIYADSFSLKPAERAEPEAPLSPTHPLLPAADSFGLNNVLISVMAHCPTGSKTTERGARGPHKCIAI